MIFQPAMLVCWRVMFGAKGRPRKRNVLNYPPRRIRYTPINDRTNSTTPIDTFVSSFGGCPWSPWEQEASPAAVALCWTIPSMYLSWSRKFIDQPCLWGLTMDVPKKTHIVFLAICASWRLHQNGSFRLFNDLFMVESGSIFNAENTKLA